MAQIKKRVFGENVSERVLEEFKKLEDTKPSPVIKSFFDKAKKFWKN